MIFISYSRFLGDDIPEPAMAVLALLPDPYTLARENTYVWTADFVDSTETVDILFNKKSGPLDLSSMRVLSPGEKLEVVLQRKEGVASLASLARDLLARLQLEVDNLPEDHLPGNLKRGLVKLTKWVGFQKSSSYIFEEKLSLSLFQGLRGDRQAQITSV